MKLTTLNVVSPVASISLLIGSDVHHFVFTVQDWMLICQYGAAFPQSEKDKDDHDWSLAGMAYPNLQELSSFISRQHLE